MPIPAGLRWPTLLYVVLFLSAAALPPPGHTAPSPRESRIALVIANTNYANPQDVLTSPANDAKLIAEALGKTGFRVTKASDLGKQAMQQAVLRFQEELDRAGPDAIGFFYYAGHGGGDQRGGDNYLLPVDVASVTGTQIDRSGVGVRWITERLRSVRSPQAMVIVIDACRSRGSAAGQQGLTLKKPDKVEERGFLVAYSTSEGKTASDKGEYAKALASRLGQRDLTLDEVFAETRIDVGKATEQIPSSASYLLSRVCLAGCSTPIQGDPLALLKLAVENRSSGDAGQITAIRQLAESGRSLAGFDLRGIYLRGGDFSKIDFREAELDGANLDKATLRGALLTQAHGDFASMRGAQAGQAHAEKARMFFADAEDANFTGIEAAQSNWQGANLKHANFQGADLRGASFMFTDLSGADFRRARLQGAFFIGAILKGAKFDGAVLDNTDMTGAVGESSAFTPAQQAALCATEIDHTYNFQLVRVTKNPRFDGGEHYDSFFYEYVALAPGLANLKRCTRRTLVETDPVWYNGEVEQVDSVLKLFLRAEWLGHGEREDRLVDRVQAMRKILNEASAAGPWIRVTGTGHRNLLAALEKNVANAALLSPPWFDATAITLFEVKYRPPSPANQFWKILAMQWVEHEARSQLQTNSAQANRWPAFFPPNTSPQQLAPEHIEAFRRWTLNRARGFPATIRWQSASPLSAARERLLNQRGGTAKTGLVYPMRAWTAAGGAVEFPAAFSGKVDRSATYMRAQGDSWGDSGTVVRLRGVDTCAVKTEKLDALVQQGARLRVDLSVSGMSVVESGTDQLKIIDADIDKCSLLAKDNTPVS